MDAEDEAPVRECTCPPDHREDAHAWGACDTEGCDCRLGADWDIFG